MRISDWSADVCSSDLRKQAIQSLRQRLPTRPPSDHLSPDRRRLQHPNPYILRNFFLTRSWTRTLGVHRGGDIMRKTVLATAAAGLLADTTTSVAVSADFRSEEHTSELQSLMRISYAVFCLQKKTQLPPATRTNCTLQYNDKL